MRTIKEALEDGSLSLEDEIDYPDMSEEEYKEEIERLNSIINNDFSKICREKMIDKLSANEMILLQDKEIERLNNIINELEKKLLELRLTDVDGRTIVYRLLDKLQELKGSNKE